MIAKKILTTTTHAEIAKKMFNEFESGDYAKRHRKQEERLRQLKDAREAGYFDEEGTEAVDIAHDGVNPCDPAPARAFTDDTPSPGNRKQYRQPMGVQEAEAKLRLNPCWGCDGLGDIIAQGGILERCSACDGSGQDNARECFVCSGRGKSIYGEVCPICNGQGIEPTQR